MRDRQYYLWLRAMTLLELALYPGKIISKLPFQMGRMTYIRISWGSRPKWQVEVLIHQEMH